MSILLHFFNIHVIHILLIKVTQKLFIIVYIELFLLDREGLTLVCNNGRLYCA